MYKKTIGFLIVGVILTLSGCFANPSINSTADEEKASVGASGGETMTTQEVQSMKLTIDGMEVPVAWENNASVTDLQRHLPLTIQMSRYGGFEQVGSIGVDIIRNDKDTTTNYGDIVLYAGNKLVIFYGTNSWAYTRLGHISLSQQEMADLLSEENVTITITEDAK